MATLAAHALQRHYPGSVGTGNDGIALLDAVLGAQASLVAKWLGVGFVHGVMNTDNSSISGETIDYGPCAFLDEYDPKKTFSSIDRGGRYAFSNQPRMALWNLARLAEALLPIIHENDDESARIATERLDLFSSRFETSFLAVLRGKLGFVKEHEEDNGLADDLFERMAANHVDFTIFFRALCDAASKTPTTTRPSRGSSSSLAPIAIGPRNGGPGSPSKTLRRPTSPRACGSTIPRSFRAIIGSRRPSRPRGVTISRHSTPS